MHARWTVPTRNGSVSKQASAAPTLVLLYLAIGAATAEKFGLR